MNRASVRMGSEFNILTIVERLLKKVNKIARIVES